MNVVWVYLILVVGLGLFLLYSLYIGRKFSDDYRKRLIETGHEDAYLDAVKAQEKYAKTEIAEAEN